MTEGEDAGHARLSGAGGQGGGVPWTGGVVRGGAVTPLVGDHSVVRVDHGGAPGGRGVGVRAPVVLHAVVLEGEDARRVGLGHARVRYSVLNQERNPLKLERRGGGECQQAAGEDQDHHGCCRSGLASEEEVDCHVFYTPAFCFSLQSGIPANRGHRLSRFLHPSRLMFPLGQFFCYFRAI